MGFWAMGRVGRPQGDKQCQAALTVPQVYSRHTRKAPERCLSRVSSWPGQRIFEGQGHLKMGSPSASAPHLQQYQSHCRLYLPCVFNCLRQLPVHFGLEAVSFIATFKRPFFSFALTHPIPFHISLIPPHTRQEI